MGKSKNPEGRPRKPFDWNLVDSLCMLEASEEFVAERLLIKEGEAITEKNTQAKIKLIQRRIKEKYRLSFVQYREKKMENRKITLRSKMWDAVDDKNPTMMIWMAKNYLGHSDKLEQRSQIQNESKNQVYVCEFPEIKMLPEPIEEATNEHLQH